MNSKELLLSYAGYIAIAGGIIWWIINMIIHWNDPISFALLWRMSWPPGLLAVAGWVTLFWNEDPTLP